MSDKMQSGSYGTVFHYGTHLVLKVTTDDNEAVFANTIKHKKFKHISNVESVFKIKNHPGYYVIILEKLEPIQDENVLNALEILPIYNDEDGFSDHADWIKKQMATIPPDVFKKTKQQYLEIIDELEKTRLPDGYADVHVGNIGIKNGNLAVYDIQVSELKRWRIGKIKSF